MSNQWVGCVVSIDCGEILGTYQGHVSAVNECQQTISLVKAYRNGAQCKIPQIMISAIDIKDLKILRSVGEQCNGIDALFKGAITASLNHLIPGSEMNIVDGYKTCQNGSVSCQTTPAKDDIRHRSYSGSEYRRKTSTPKKIEGRRRYNERDNDCFSAPIDSFILENDFDFEKNLALFNKQAIFDEINASSKPDLLRQTEKQPIKYRHDENILESKPASYKQIVVSEYGGKDYFTDSGLVVPSISYDLRVKLFSAMEKHCMSQERKTEFMGRAASEMVLQLLGGSYRLNPHNTHQKPCVVVLCGPHVQGAEAACCARHLANHNVNVTLFVPNFVKLAPVLATEVALFKLTDGTQTSHTKDLPPGPVDIIVNALDSHENKHLRDQSWYRNIIQWTTQCKPPVLTMDPPSEGVIIETKWSLVPALPLNLHESVGSLYLCDLGIPRDVFLQAGIRYLSPFGSKFVIPLYSRLKT